MTGNKPILRKRLRAARRALNDDQRRQAAAGLLNRLLELAAFREAKHIAMYLTNDGEIDPCDVMQWAWEQGKRCYLPIVIQTNLNSLLFAPVTRSTQYVENRYGISEPVVEEHELIGGSELDLVLLPLVGFDNQGNRIGMGGGFYDTTFEFVREQAVSKPTMIGIAHELQRVDAIDAERWDIPLSTIVTDKGIYRANFSPD